MAICAAGDSYSGPAVSESGDTTMGHDDGDQTMMESEISVPFLHFLFDRVILRDDYFSLSKNDVRRVSVSLA